MAFVTYLQLILMWPLTAAKEGCTLSAGAEMEEKRAPGFREALTA